MLFHRQVAPRIPTIALDGLTIDCVNEFRYLGTKLDAKLSFKRHIEHIRMKIRKNSNVFKRLVAKRMTSAKIANRLFNAYIRPYYQSLLNIFPILAINKIQQLEAMNRQMFRIMHGWYDSSNVEVELLPKYRTMAELATTHWEKLKEAIIRTNPSILQDFLQHKLAIVYLKDYFTILALKNEKRKIFHRGRTRRNIVNFLEDRRRTLFDHTFCIRE
jgi:hypothetical protein